MNKFNLEEFAKSDLSFLLVSDNKVVFESRDQGLRPLVFCFQKHQKEMAGGKVFDKIVGRAAALIFSLAKVLRIITPKITREALDILHTQNIYVEFGEIIEKVMNRDGTDLCPMEKLSSGKTAGEFWNLLNEKK